MVNSFALPGISFPRYHCFHTTDAKCYWDPTIEQTEPVEMWTKIVDAPARRITSQRGGKKFA
jgi:hypothetical protein